MRNSRPNIPSRPSQNRQAILRQNTSATEERMDAETTTSDRTNGTTARRAHGESVEPADRQLYQSVASKFPIEKFAALLAVLGLVVSVVWYFALQDSTVKNLVDDTKDLKKKFDETSRTTIESSYRITNIERRITASEQQRERSVNPASGGTAHGNVIEQASTTPKQPK